jgi:mycothiol synthase
MQIRDFTMTDLNQVVAIQNAVVPFQALTQHELENDLIKLEENIRPVFIVVEENGSVVGAANYHRFAGAYHPNKFGIEIWVNPENQGRGIGSALYTALLEKLAPLEPISVSTQVRESDTQAMRFAASRGYLEIKRDFESLLDITNFSSEPYQTKISSLEQSGVQLLTWQEAGLLERRQELHQVFGIVRHDVPRAEPPTPISFEFLDENVLMDAETLQEASFYALENNKIIGFTGCFRGAKEGWVDQWLTATTREARGRGIATALKIKQIQVVQKLGFTTIRTDNDTRNTAMLAINDKLGFERQPAVLVMKKEFAKQ